MTIFWSGPTLGGTPDPLRTPSPGPESTPVILGVWAAPGAPETLPMFDIIGLRLGDANYNLYLVIGRFPAELGPETRSNGSGSKMVQKAPKISPGD